MKCWHCNTELRWCDDVDVSEEYDDWSFMSILDCKTCGSLVEVYFPKETHQKCFGEKEKDDDTKSTVSTTK
tara:strand:- start:274 stop:486 length:213 start_codon:yes stop_codon:yes gene_type:complete